MSDYIQLHKHSAPATGITYIDCYCKVESTLKWKHLQNWPEDQKLGCESNSPLLPSKAVCSRELWVTHLMLTLESHFCIIVPLSLLMFVWSDWPLCHIPSVTASAILPPVSLSLSDTLCPICMFSNELILTILADVWSWFHYTIKYLYLIVFFSRISLLACGKCIGMSPEL